MAYDVDADGPVTDLVVAALAIAARGQAHNSIPGRRRRPGRVPGRRGAGQLMGARRARGAQLGPGPHREVWRGA